MQRLLVAAALTFCGCNWISLGANALTYDTLAAGEAGNIVARDSVAYVSLADSGFAVLDGSGLRVALIPAAPGMESVDDLALDGDVLFTLDARPPGAFALWSVRDPRRPTILTPSRPVPVGPFSGISARDGLCIVSGGTSLLTTWRYDARGTIDSAGVIDLGRGQPDVIVASRVRAFVSTHYWGPYFGIDVLGADGAPARVGRMELDDAGFTTGGAKPANFPIEPAMLDSATLLVAYARGLAVVRLTRDSIRLERAIDVGGPATSVDTQGRVAAVTVGGREPAVAFVDFTRTPPRVRRVTLPAGTKPVGIALSTRNALVAARGQGVLVVQR